MSFLIYGAGGYTGTRIVELAVKQGLEPVIAGRSEAKIKPLADRHGLEYVIFELSDKTTTLKALEKFPLVLNCAGPFTRTAQPLVEACLKTQTHYLDITGEIEVFEWVKSCHAQALSSKIILMPGVGFDVVPTDCMAKWLHTQLPDATQLELAFTNVGGSISHGTMTTMLEGLGNPGAARENGKIVPKPIGAKGKMIDFGKLTRFAMTIPWGDVSTAHHTTGIPNIDTYAGAPKLAYFFMKLQFLFNPLLRAGFIKKQLQKYVDKKITGPTESQSRKGQSLIWGKVTNAAGKTTEARLITPEGYTLTAEASLLITQKILALKDAAGYQTPAGLFGYELITEIKGSSFEYS
ncbi:saccharopine dehydrogenase family protein [Runella slithyformis]|uniref:Saccharopine dehydrogenase n=1 Tax=Runella slithyformis (strain ATCC 29530 / DSM 19594 / LMG 11500 / NCIMB 11436 / LSU 4) TaxID=761193 RepID=A0A7U3ZMG6_RUNSL|nr:saccharopine dehydrogenase NADP-binding domain-containing protein [Runella slithyformis]AEI49897.1 Saccharopine dehydrogenase [Runella slithyformis DSM 19594]